MPNSPAPLIGVERGGVREATHFGHLASVDAAGRIYDRLGDPDVVAYFRSCAKPFQTIAGLRAEIVPRYGLTPEHIAIMSASHNGEPRHLAIVRDLLAHADLEEGALQCGAHWPYYEPAAAVVRREMAEPIAVFNNCSGKHAGMLALCRAHGWDTQGYRLPDHPVQQACRAAHAEAADADASELATATDGCGVVTFALPLERMAYAFARLESLPAGERIAGAMRAHPDLVGGPDGADFQLMRAAPGWFAKGGAEGLLCAAGPGGIGVVLKCEDGSSRPLEPALAAFLAPLGVDLPGLAELPIVNSRGEHVGEFAVSRL
jgi:L-asparaginase II